MNEELQLTLNGALVSIIQNAASAKEFVLAELPVVVEQLLMWNMYISFAWFVVWVIALSVLVFYTVRAFRNAWDGDGIMALVVGSVISLFGIVSNTDWLQIMIAPKLYLLEYAAELVK